VFIGSSSCNYIVIGKWEKKHQEIEDMLLRWSHEQLARDYNLDAEQFMIKHGVDVTTALAGYTAATRDLLDACFKPAESTAFIKNTNVLKQMGRITYAMDSECTATLIGDPRYIITARHCFSTAAKDPASAKHMWFIPYLSSDRFQVCSIAEKNALATEKFESINYDQVLVRVAPTGLPLAPIRAISNQEIKTTADEKKGDRAAPLLLASVSYFPLAPIVSPDKFSSGYVVPQTEICAAIAKDKSCFAHICSAIGGGSGSPIFVESGAKIVLAGTHVGGSTDTVGACQQSGAQINAAASIHISDAPNFFSSAAQH
jgi:V8-like Glu-specific endopeptidase